jgi:hypothetical protein
MKERVTNTRRPGQDVQISSDERKFRADALAVTPNNQPVPVPPYSEHLQRAMDTTVYSTTKKFDINSLSPNIPLSPPVDTSDK